MYRRSVGLWLKTALCCCAAALFIMGLCSLVETPERPAEETEMPSGTCREAMLWVMPSMTEEAARTDERPGPKTEQAVLADCGKRMASAPVSDRNGVPLEKRAYFRAFWQAFPPEGTPG